MNGSQAGGGLARYRVHALFVMTALYVGVKTFAHDYWSVGFGLSVLSIILLTPEPTHEREPWRGHALRVVSACFVVVTLASILTTLSEL
ncbi:MAG: hypothetical protein K0R38_885 [Polyangiaceae bacterium]|jgi:hypothetical protein|nr:hypothetical protein [Polyangiaceae bacterium]